MTRQAKKDLERHYLERVRGLVADFPSGRIEDREPPDFLLHAGERVIGIEVTELHQTPDGQPLPLQAREAVREQITARAKAIYDGGGHPPVDSKFHLKDLPFHRTEIEPLAIAIAELTRRNIPSDGTLCLSERYDWDNRDYFPEVVDYIRVARYDGLIQSYFSCDGHTWPGPMAADHIRSVIKAKEAHIDEYLRRSDEAWLIIAADSHRMATWFLGDAQVRAATFVTRFSRVFVLRNLEHEVLELTISAGELAG